jgi:hypothetical protein
MTIYLLVKTHNITGLKYLCKTKNSNYHKYSGSGTYWKDHLRIHGKNYSTELLQECKVNKEVEEWGLYYSALWNIVDAKDSNGKKLWANLVPESGQGHSNGIQKIIQNRPEVKMKNRLGVLAAHAKDPEIRKKQSKWSLENNPMSIPEIRKKHKQIVSVTNLGERNGSYDKRIHYFYHDSGIEERCTQHQLRKKYNLKSCGISQLVNGHKIYAYGWQIIKDAD